MPKLSQSLTGSNGLLAKKLWNELAQKRVSYALWVLVPVSIAISFVATGAGAPPAIPPVVLAAEPLYAALVVDKPTIALALSVEFPTVGAQYVQTPGSSDDSAYSYENEYLGYYDAESCYAYNNAPTETRPSGLTLSDYKRFDRSGAATNRKCAGENFSGNFLNWASSSAVDMLRLALSGGDRYIDTSSLTILQRAVLPDASVSTNFWNGTNFPSKNLTRAGKSGANDFWGAIPQSMRSAAGTNNIAIANDSNKIYFRAGSKQGTTKASASSYTLGSSGSSILNTDGYFFARVQVCDKNGAGDLLDSRDYKLCKQYPAGNYKPVGAIQKYSDQLRLAAFGYMPQSKNNSAAGATFGGVLRAPMKYVGSKTYNINGQDNTASGGNPNAEWNLNTGEFIKNPDSDVEFGNSGVINYLNKFGRTGATQGLYKYYDPLGELYYETLRYLQGLQPSPAAIGSITTAMKDGFPVYTSWSDPYGGGRTPSADYSCLKSNIVVIGDVNIDSSGSARYPSLSAANNVPDIASWLSIVNNFEKGTVVSYLDGQGVSRNTGNPNATNSSMPSDKMIGLAYWAHTHDIRGSNWTGEAGSGGKQRPGLRVKTFSFDVNEFGDQLNDNTRRNLNELFMVAKYGGFQSDPSNPGKKPFNTFGNPFKRQDGTNDNDVWRDPIRLGPNGAAGGIGEASTYYLQSNARGVLSAFDEIFSRASTSSRSVAGGGLSTGAKVTSNSVSYSAKFDTSNWSGDVVAEPITQDASNNLTVSTQLWSAAQRLDNRISPASNRKIFVGRSGATSSTTATTFTWTAIDGALQDMLNKPSPAAAPDGLGADRLAYLRGDRTKEGAPFRVRSSLLGDIVNSNISYSGAPSKAHTGTGYAAFRAAYDSRPAAVFAGGNDGMLHAFNAATGDELFAYIPSWVGRNLPALADPAFSNNHQNYVDAPSVISEAQVASTGASTDWKTVLVSGTGGGGSGVFALDISDPVNFGASNVMWEFTRADDADMGQVVGAPKILKIKTSGTSATVTYRWFAAVGSGVNNYVPDADNRFSATGRPALFLLALDKPAGVAWSLGANYFKISVPTDSSVADSNATGLANFSALYGTQGEMTDIYMGDLHGALWRLKFSGKVPADWSMDKLSYFDKGSAGSPIPYPLYLARTGDASPKVQPIFAAPTAFAGPIVGGVESFYIVFGTGKYLESGDNISTTAQTLYAVYDNGSTAADNSPASLSVITGRGRLQGGVVNTTTKVITVSAFKWGRPSANSDTTSRAGWYFDLPVSGERIDQAALDLGTLNAAVNSKIPGSTAAGAGSCSNTLGSGNQYFLSINNGSASYVPSSLGLLGPPVLLSNDSEMVVTPSDSTGRRLRTTTLRRFTQTQSGIDTSAPPVTTKETIGRLNWRQIFNYQDMKSAP
ncbi:MULTISPECIES: pilus assembly protein [unclassified Acidovorax]|uniref:pilus assembly protein n=1 Tax=unclassified Acidovorax TaxID=2684926 RepID=UPI000C17D6C9|nr:MULTISPECIES: PilC/PilY family type IV pilus protein [unclassified Acidovorax]PIF18810.1 type IV pilus assembly protein PilY1 [Acidovorax sp. 59]PKW02163.1 type IV pilus assembly protein PilY1 [Acidovorax sp. 30]